MATDLMYAFGTEADPSEPRYTTRRIDGKLVRVLLPPLKP
jgi:hypothetical protein